MAGSARREDPYGAFNFLVEIDGVELAAFSEVSGLDSSVDVIEYRNGSDDFTVRKLPGLKKYTNLVLKRGLTGDRSLWEWHKTVLDGKMEQRTVTVKMLDEARQPVTRFVFRNAWPCRWSGPHFDASISAVAIETLEICHEGIELE
jgi:phage tail-like protein